MIVRVERGSEYRYSTLAAEAMQDPRLSWEARGMLAYLLSKPDSWEVRIGHLVGQAPASKQKVQRILAELERCGYLERRRERDARGRFVWLSIVYERPQKRGQTAGAAAVPAGPPWTQNPCMETPSLAEPSLENPCVENPSLAEPSLENPCMENPSPVPPSTVNHPLVNTDIDITSLPSGESAESAFCALCALGPVSSGCVSSNLVSADRSSSGPNRKGVDSVVGKGIAGATLPVQKGAKSGAASRARSAAKKPVPPAVAVYRSATHLYPPKSWFEELDKIVGDSPEALARWREVVMAWIGTGFSPRNVRGMAEHFQRGEIPGTRPRPADAGGNGRYGQGTAGSSEGSSGAPAQSAPASQPAKRSVLDDPDVIFDRDTGVAYLRQEVENKSPEEIERFVARLIEMRDRLGRGFSKWCGERIERLKATGKYDEDELWRC